jgi:para-nitrobenzyl esterase
MLGACSCSDKLKRLALIIVLSAFSSSIQNSWARSDTLNVESGLISGLRNSESSVLVFKGIPYAAPPVGDLRWRAPQPHPGWEGVLTANEFSPVCMQTPPTRGTFYHTEFNSEPEPMSEDCLCLNIWTSASSRGEERPVMVWIHGGGFSHGSGSMPAFNGESFARKGVVLVTINFRLGIFGLLAHPELTDETDYRASGNYGLLDQTAALKWVQRNIKTFGGDPDNVTVFGQSSGAGNINKLMVSPLARGLFHRAILQSGTAYTFGRRENLETAEKYGSEFVSGLGAGSIIELRTWSASDLLEKSRSRSFAPNIDGWILEDQVQNTFSKGDQQSIPVLTGSVAHEGSAFFGPQFSVETFVQIIRNSYGEDADAFLRLYPHDTDEQASESYTALWRDLMAWGAHTLARIHRQTGRSDVWVYYFNKVPPGRNSRRYGAYHSSELVYVFDTFTEVDRPWEPSDKSLSHQVISYWVNFAKNGNPNGGELPNWPVYDPGKREVLEFGIPVDLRVILDDEIIQLLDKRNRSSW